MGCDHHWEKSGVVCRIAGTLTGKEFDAAWLKYRLDPRYVALRYLILDCRDCTDTDVSNVELEKFGMRARSAMLSNPNVRVAMVTTKPEIAVVLDAIDQLSLGCLVVQCFGTMDEARTWVNTQ